MSIETYSCQICTVEGLRDNHCVLIFNNEFRSSSNEDIATLIKKLLSRDLTEDPSITQVICKKCFTLIIELEELQNRVAEIKNEILMETGKIEDEGSDNEIKLDVTEDIGSKESATKTLLFIPSSDEDSSQVSSQKQVFDDAEIEAEMNIVEMKTGLETETAEQEETLNEFQHFPAEEVDMLDSGAVEHSSDSDYEPPRSMFVKVQSLAEKNIIADNVKVKIEPPPIEDTITTPTISNDKKPNILKKKIFTPAPTIELITEEKKPETIMDFPAVQRDGNMYTCLLCEGDETVAGEAKAIMAHVKEAHQVRLYICDVCGQDFLRRNHLSAHLDEHIEQEDGDFQCEVCNRIFSNLRLFRIHKRMHYPQTKGWECETCGKRYSSKNLLEEHANIHLGVRPYVCAACGKDFASKYTFKAHEKTHEARPRPFKCAQCGKSFLSQQNLTQHERTHLGMKEYSCHLCGKHFGSSHNLEVHSIVHTGFKPYICGLCGKAFARKAEIRDHERTHTGERPYQCEFCGSTFSQRSNLQSHKRATHYDDKRYQCSECGKGFKRRRLLDYHIKAAHTGERPFKCEICEATFVYPEHFKKHRRIHTGEKPFLCEVCGKAFNSRDNRNAHRFVHSDKKPYECLVCAAGFMRKPLLYQHMQAQGHLNDTIVVNQPRLTTDDDQLVTVNSAGEIEIVDASSTESKLFIQDPDGAEHIIIDGQQIGFAQIDSDDEENGEVIESIEQIVDENGDEEEYEEVITGDTLSESDTQIIDTPEWPVQLVKVRIPNENGEEEEAWIKIMQE
ncbi:unnamed protein product [Phaedon cochleariae]|uniref:Zinc finger protein n=1 Tax=Phaedon cochleariae TaxID=80249 RepID=A0A9P0GWC7_PHACE|nr:unnamed protein product [Phaedon cochleariae]